MREGRVRLAATLNTAPGGLALARRHPPPGAPQVAATRHHGAMLTFDDALRSIDDRFARLREEKRIPGIAWGVIREGELVHAGGSGTVREVEDACRTPTRCSGSRR